MHVHVYIYIKLTSNCSNSLGFKGATGLYKPVGGAGASVCTILACFTSGTLFSKLRNTYK